MSNSHIDSIDFSAMFKSHFGHRSHVYHKLRFNTPHLLHDIAFMNGLIHDSKFHLSGIVIEHRSMLIPIARDRWEKYNNSNQIESVDSHIVVQGVLSTEWRFNNLDALRKAIFQIDGIHIAKDYRFDDRAYVSLYLCGIHGWSLSMRLDSNALRLHLDDDGRSCGAGNHAELPGGDPDLV